ncbi:MAG: hypothetical protein K2O34_15025, partial [Acetatifactor sp.]|nr:hypothetical protein [Acetatifactor sp.]
HRYHLRPPSALRDPDRRQAGESSKISEVTTGTNVPFYKKEFCGIMGKIQSLRPAYSGQEPDN